ncbi:hypothetical protein L2E82_48441 [Cichorium intybus]|uniref:Uncharacterized protein n=1 Tax=Cichorium intybus TaxID=13427 RepID=A0ACB8YZ89_CICIN|nr:hypothetical protein L2E82_48441 [Cichorium intybus]
MEDRQGWPGSICSTGACIRRTDSSSMEMKRLSKVDGVKGMVTISEARLEAEEGVRGRRVAEPEGEGCTGGLHHAQSATLGDCDLGLRRFAIAGDVNGVAGEDGTDREWSFRRSWRPIAGACEDQKGEVPT